MSTQSLKFNLWNRHIIEWYNLENFNLVIYSSIIFRIAQNFGGVKLWRINRFRVLVRKTLANILTCYWSGSGIWLDKILVNDIYFTKVFPAPLFLHCMIFFCSCNNITSQLQAICQKFNYSYLLKTIIVFIYFESLTLQTT